MNRRDALATGAAAGISAAAAAQEKEAPIKRRDPLRISRLETFLVQPRWLFLKVHTNAGITGLGEPILEGRALTCAQAINSGSVKACDASLSTASSTASASRSALMETKN